MNKYTRRLFFALGWFAFFIIGGVVDYWLAENGLNQFTLSKLLIWGFTKSAIFMTGIIFMTGYLFGHLGSPQDPLSPEDT